MVDFLLCSVFIIAIATALVALSCVMAGKEYDRWVSEFEERGGVKSALEPVLMGSEVVGYTVVQERRCRPR
jgi:hypothetical protein